MHFTQIPRQKHRFLRMLFAAATIASTTAIAPHARASVPIYGGPEYDSTTASGYQIQTVPFNPGQSAGNGVGVGWAYKTISATPLGVAAIRWNTATAPNNFTELDPLSTDSSGNAFSFANAINDLGATVGTSEEFSGPLDLGTRAVLWSPTSASITELGNLGTDPTGSTSSSANAINDSRAIAGSAEKYASDGSDLGQRAVRWNASSTTATELGTLGLNSSNQTTASAVAINAAGFTVGSSEKYTPTGTDLGSRAVRWDPITNTATELGNLGTDLNGNTSGQASAINSPGASVGYMNKYISNQFAGTRAVRWDSGSANATELGNLGTENSSGTDTTTSQAYSINIAGTSVGFAAKYVANSFQGFRAVRWDPTTTTATELGNLGTDPTGSTTSEAYAINDSGISVGFSEKYASDGTDQGQVAVAWQSDTTPIDLNSLLSPTDATDWTLTEADSISNTNWITGIGSFDPDGPGPAAAYQRDFLVQLPEPTSLMLLIPALVSLASRRRT